MKKYVKRIAAFALSLVVALGSVCYKPPKAEAVVAETAVGTAVTAAYLESIGLSVGVAGDVAAALSTGVGSVAASYATATGTAASGSAFLGSVAAGATISPAGVIILTAAGAALLGGLAVWLIHEFGLVGEDGTPVTEPVVVVPGSWSLELPGSELYWNTELRPYYVFFTAVDIPGNENNFMLASEAPLTTDTFTPTTGEVKRYLINRTDEDINGVLYEWLNGDWTVCELNAILGTDRGWRIKEIFASSYNVCDTYDNSVYFYATDDLNVPDYSNPVLSVSLSENYGDFPDLSENESMHIDTGLTYKDDESFIDAVMDGVAAGTLSPSYTVEADTESWIYNGVSLPALPDGVKDYQFITYFPDFDAAYLYVADSRFYVDSEGYLRCRDGIFDMFIYDPNGIAGEVCSDWTLSASNISTSVLGDTVDWANEDIADERTGLVYIQGTDITIPDSGADSGPDVGEDTEDGMQAGILSWMKKIWQSVVDLPKSIADAIANVFVPSEEYIAVLPETVAATFDERTGFLTYPVSVLYDFADKLSRGQSDFILKWPTVIEPYSGGQLMAAGQFNVSKYVRDNDFASDVYTIYQWVIGGYLTFLFLGLCRRKYNSVIGDRLGG